MNKTAALVSLIALASCASHRPEPARLAIASFDDVRADFRGEPVISGRGTADQLHDLLVAGGHFKGVERRYSPDPARTPAPGDWVITGTVEATVRGDFDPGETRRWAVVSIHVRVVRVEDAFILYAKTHRGEADGTVAGTEWECMMEGIRLLEVARKTAVTKLAREIEALAH